MGLIIILWMSSELKWERTGIRDRGCQQFTVKSNIWGTKKRSIVSTDTFWHIFCPKEQMEGLLLKWEVWKHRLVLQVNSVVSCLLRDTFFLRHPPSRNTSPDTHFLQFVAENHSATRCLSMLPWWARRTKLEAKLHGKPLIYRFSFLFLINKLLWIGFSPSQWILCFKGGFWGISMGWEGWNKLSLELFMPMVAPLKA